MTSGNKTRAQQEMRDAILESMKESFAEGRPMDWAAKSWERGLREMTRWATEASRAVVADMDDRGEVGYITGRFTRVDMLRGIEMANRYYEAILVTQTSYRQKKMKAFRQDFEERFRRLTVNWKEESDVYFNLSRSV